VAKATACEKNIKISFKSAFTSAGKIDLLSFWERNYWVGGKTGLREKMGFSSFWERNYWVWDRNSIFEHKTA
jgi:hypothetical protein